MYRRELLKGSTDTMLLSLLAREPMYGYQIVKEMAHRTDGYFRFREGTLYPALHRLEGDSLVVGTWQEGPRGQLRRTYSITEKGGAKLASLQEEWRQFSRAVNLLVQPL